MATLCDQIFFGGSEIVAVYDGLDLVWSIGDSIQIDIGGNACFSAGWANEKAWLNEDGWNSNR